MREGYVIILFLVLTVTLTACGSPKNKVVGGYDASKLGGDFLKSHNNAYEIGANEDDMPIFKDVDKAFKQALIDFEDGFKTIQKEYDLKPISKKNYEDYFTYGWQITTDNENLKNQCIEITQFLDIYENSFK